MKILNIKGCPTSKQVLLYVHRDDTDGDYVAIVAWHLHEENNYIQQETVTFGEEKMADMERFIADYSQESANAFVNSMTF